MKQDILVDIEALLGNEEYDSAAPEIDATWARLFRVGENPPKATATANPIMAESTAPPALSTRVPRVETLVQRSDAMNRAKQE